MKMKWLVLACALTLGVSGPAGCGRRPEKTNDSPAADATAPKSAAVAITFGETTRGDATWPAVKTHPDEAVRRALNAKLEAAFGLGKGEGTDFDLERNDRLLIVTRRTVSNTSGEYAAITHDTRHFDLGTGVEYALGDLVLDPRAFRTRLLRWVRERVDAEQLPPAALTALEGPPGNPGFRIGKAALRVVLRSGSARGGDLAEHHLVVPWGELDGALHVQGELWSAFGKTVLTRRQLQDLARQAVAGYVTSFSAAVNTRDFSRLAPFLLRDDNPKSFYRTQEKLLRHYEKKDIRVHLDDHRVVALREVVDGVHDLEFRAFTEEHFTIETGRRRTAAFHWEYTLEYLADEGRFALTDIEKWDPSQSALRAATAEEIPPPGQPAGDLKKKVIRLTFDDGPNRKVTPGILDALRKHRYKATFFMLSPNMKVNAALLGRMKDEGHTLALHGATHDHRLLYRSGDDDAVVRSMEEAGDVIARLTGVRSYLCRVPYGSARNLTPVQLRRLRSSGFRVWDWNLDSQDTKKGATPALVAAHTMAELKRIKGEVVVLMHDNVHTLQALPEILEFIERNRWEVEPISPDFVGRVFIEKTI